jgi:ABC-type transport system involved in cytochrome c biogenesis permease component
MAAATIGALMTALTLGLYLPNLIFARSGSTADINDALNNIADTLLYAGATLALAQSLPRSYDRVEKA